jgi:hypothetical protein
LLELSVLTLSATLCCRRLQTAVLRRLLCLGVVTVWDGRFGFVAFPELRVLTPSRIAVRSPPSALRVMAALVPWHRHRG